MARPADKKMRESLTNVMFVGVQETETETEKKEEEEEEVGVWEQDRM